MINIEGATKQELKEEIHWQDRQICMLEREIEQYKEFFKQLKRYTEGD